MATPESYRACECSDDPHLHFQTLEQLRAYLDAGAPLGLEIWVDALRVPDFDNADEADLWLWNRDAVEALELDREWHLEHFGRRGRI